MSLNFSSDRSLAEALHRSCRRHVSRLALIEVDRNAEISRLTYGDVLREGERLASLMIARGLKPGDRCVLLLPNQSKWIVTALAVFWAGGILVPIDVKLPPSEQAALIDYVEPAMVISAPDVWSSVEAALRSDFRRTPVFIVGGFPEQAPSHWIPWGTPAAVSDELAGRIATSRGREDVATIIFTSGTGGAPKGCMLPHGAYLAQMESLLPVFPVTEKDRYLSIIPANHVIDFMCGFLIPAVTGSLLVHQRTLRSQYIVETLRKYRITFMAVVPLLLESLQRGIMESLETLPPGKKKILKALMALNAAVTKRRPKFWLSRLLLKPLHDRFGGRLARLIVGGSFVDKGMADFFYGMGFGICIGYGMTEVCTCIALNDFKPYRGDTVGRILPRGEVEIRDLHEGGVGEVWIRAPYLMKGYFKNEALSAETIVDGWLKSGDIGCLDDSGHLKLTGRSKNMIVTEGGKNIYPEDVEVAFRNLKECDEYCVFSSHYVWPEKDVRKDKLVLIVRPNSEAYADAGFAEKLKQANRMLEHHKRISGYLLWPEPFPRTASLKIKREPLARAIRDIGPHSSHIVPL